MLQRWYSIYIWIYKEIRGKWQSQLGVADRQIYLSFFVLFWLVLHFPRTPITSCLRWCVQPIRLVQKVQQEFLDTNAACGLRHTVHKLEAHLDISSCWLHNSSRSLQARSDLHVSVRGTLSAVCDILRPLFQDLTKVTASLLVEDRAQSTWLESLSST